MKGWFAGLSWVPWAVSAVAGVLLVGWLYLAGRHDGVEAERPKTELAADDGAARGLEVRGERESASRVQAAAKQEQAARAATARLATRAATSGDANAPMDPDRAERLRAHDRELCRIAPRLEGCGGLAGDNPRQPAAD